MPLIGGLVRVRVDHCTLRSVVQFVRATPATLCIIRIVLLTLTMVPVERMPLSRRSSISGLNSSRLHSLVFARFGAHRDTTTICILILVMVPILVTLLVLWQLGKCLTRSWIGRRFPRQAI